MRRAATPSGGRFRIEYEQRVNRVIDHIRAHLAEELSLKGLARVAAFSPFHFARVFRATTGETLFAFVHRVRIEQAARALAAHPDESVLAVALDHGFSSSAVFARAFRAHFGMSATAWRAGGAERWRTGRQRTERNLGKQVRKAGKAPRGAGLHTPRKPTEEEPMDTTVKALPSFHVAYMRNVGPYGDQGGIPELWAKFNKWMETRGLLTPARITLGIAYDEPDVTAPEKCRYDACVVVPPDFAADRWVNLMDVPAGGFAVTEFVGTAHEIRGAWEQLFREWLPGSGYQPDDRPCFEIYRGDPSAGGPGRRFRCELCLSVRPL